MSEKIDRERFLPHPPDAVWAALTDAERLSAWFGAVVEIDPRVGGRATFRFADGRVRAAVVEVADPPRLLKLRWLPFGHDRDGTLHQLPAGEIKYVLGAIAGGTRLVVSERRGAQLRGPQGLARRTDEMIGSAR